MTRQEIDSLVREAAEAMFLTEQQIGTYRNGIEFELEKEPIENRDVLHRRGMRWVHSFISWHDFTLTPPLTDPATQRRIEEALAAAQTEKNQEFASKCQAALDAIRQCNSGRKSPEIAKIVEVLRLLKAMAPPTLPQEASPLSPPQCSHDAEVVSSEQLFRPPGGKDGGESVSPPTSAADFPTQHPRRAPIKWINKLDLD